MSLSIGVCINDFVCKHCNCVVDEAVDLPCKHFVCLPCSIALLSLSSNTDSIHCPDCNTSHELVASSFLPPSTLTIRFIEQLVIHCDKDPCCKQGVYLRDLRAHVESNCKYTSHIQSSVTVSQILDKPASTPPMQLEMQMAGHVVRKILSQSKEPFSLPTNGCVSHLNHLSNLERLLVQL